MVVRLFVFLLITFTVQVSAAQWQMPVARDASNFQTGLAIDFARQVQKNTNNRVKISVFPDGELFKGEQIFGAVKSNLVPIGARLISALDHEDVLLQLDALPFLATNYREAFNLYKVSRSEIEKVLEVKGVKLLYAVPWPSQGLYSHTTIDSLDELKGKRFRPYSKVTKALGEKLGMTSQLVPLKQLDKTLKQKKIDYLFGSALASGTLGLDRYFPFWYELHAWLPKSMVVINLSVWNGLSGEEQKGILDAARATEGRGWVMSKRVSEQAKQQLVNSGITVEVLQAPLQRQFEVLGLSIVQQWLQDVGDRGRYIIERYVAANKKSE